MMFALIHEVAYEGECFMGIFATREAAEAALLASGYDSDVYVREVEVGKVYDFFDRPA